MKQNIRTVILAAGLAAMSPVVVQAQETLRIAVPGFLTGGAAASMGVPAQNGAEIIVDAVNNGTLPAPYNSKGLAGVKIEVEFIDEAGGNNKQVSEFRNLVQKRGFNVVVGYVSSGTCQAIAPVAEELKTLTVFTICGTPRIFEEGLKKYVFRTQMLATAEAVAAARYVHEVLPNLKSYTGINQNYAWGQDSWNDFVAAMSKLSSAKAADTPLWPKLSQGQYASEISALQLSNSELIHSSLWGSDIDSFINQGKGRGIFASSKVLLTMGGSEAALQFGDKMPKNVIVGSRGPYGLMAKGIETPLNRWFTAEFKKRYGKLPPSPAYQTAAGLLAVKQAYDTAAKKAGRFPSMDEVITAFEGMTFDAITTSITMALSNGHQAIYDMSYGETDIDPASSEIIVKNLKTYAASCINPPDRISSEEWLRSGLSPKCP